MALLIAANFTAITPMLTEFVRHRHLLQRTLTRVPDSDQGLRRPGTCGLTGLAAGSFVLLTSLYAMVVVVFTLVAGFLVRETVNTTLRVTRTTTPEAESTTPRRRRANDRRADDDGPWYTRALVLHTRPPAGRLPKDRGAMKRSLFDADHEAFRESVRAFVATEIVPNFDTWVAAGIVPRKLFLAAGKSGFLGMDAPEEYGGGGVPDFRFNRVIIEELMVAGVASAGLGIILHNDVCMPCFRDYTTAEQQSRWFPGLVSGELITAVAMTEPGTGSDLASVTTTARRDGDYYNGINSDLVITAVKTDPRRKHKGISLLVLERGMEGLERGRKLDKLGEPAQDTAELSFSDVRAPEANLLGEKGQGFAQLVSSLPQERLSIAVAATAAARAALDWTLEYVKERKAFRQPTGSFQNSRFVLAEIATEVDLAQHYTDACIRALNAGDLTAVDASKAKYWCSKQQGRVVDRCLQLHGGYGYINEYPIARAFVDARITRIYGGTTEIMKEVIGRSLGLGSGGLNPILGVKCGQAFQAARRAGRARQNAGRKSAKWVDSPAR
ncbi:acyl-CoA dehydrogenase family protein [Amycolatopsis sp.]|uniref:acyl-CoA dehydrogenase family protein n=1 Tax=Amycolatopsis sp. TaxID=37632 RepID=UPI002CAA90A4|nr:acyl-CoA dehydrogenase family protein [Amycolatopsis sp.]HVV11874.1 acyl-CoA dehydrogenase family protein [Amycolatopsis sp.]